ncbi:MAG: hypothetical protein HGB15_11340 [Chlorobaculum sp.]|nr:hypothetical protein [Chlorobaculum sp.]
MHACREMGIWRVSIYSTVDVDFQRVRYTNEPGRKNLNLLPVMQNLLCWMAKRELNRRNKESLTRMP